MPRPTPRKNQGKVEKIVECKLSAGQQKQLSSLLLLKNPETTASLTRNVEIAVFSFSARYSDFQNGPTVGARLAETTKVQKATAQFLKVIADSSDDLWWELNGNPMTPHNKKNHFQAVYKLNEELENTVKSIRKQKAFRRRRNYSINSLCYSLLEVFNNHSDRNLRISTPGVKCATNLIEEIHFPNGLRVTGKIEAKKRFYNFFYLF